MTRRNSRRAGLIALVTSVGLVLGFGTAAPAQAAAAEDHNAWYTEDDGSVLTYQVHLPPAYSSGKPLPVVVALHGCAMTGFGLNSMKDLTNLNPLADEQGFIVVYPDQALLKGGLLHCWNGQYPEQQHRGHGEPAAIAGITENVLTAYHGDRSRVHVLGASSGAGLAVIMGVTYPDVYASVLSMAGAEYAIDEVDPNNPNEIGPVDTAKRAWAQMGRHARPVPVMIAQGTADTTVPPFLADRLVTHWAAIDDLAMNGCLDGQMDDKPDHTVTVTKPGQHTYIERTYVPRDGGPALIDYVVVDGMKHAWPGPGKGTFVDNSGPDLARLWWSFASRQHLP
ncbi:extracellular catalytic domain type 1 short-chain-length polyhydroxyalkanoate depolymerase [Kutzneria sp. CA-103260]|uniref:extracellular catalytic domain type 1 short-chain-length polyhydroxyalkanoate depolymerase n=1 Tax=Kutzneria sp. CA-103260 TaxID=2802641 RepID=UPI001BA5902C|nr:PHB depolymerase family esterase [Kutzneria sp. CA-103260]QUQ64140.1 Esterase PHB depolymerase [Kutzneria sp. CA-103260]